MADVQVENGYTRIANELIEQLARIKLSGRQWNILMVIIRQTYGYNRKECDISNKYISEVTGIHRCHVSRELSSLQEYGILYMEDTHGKRSLKINKDYERWSSATKNVTKNGNSNELPELVTDVTEIGINVLPELVTDVTEIGNHTYKRKLKEKKENSKEREHTDFFEEIWKLYPNKKGKSAVSKKAKEELYNAGFETVKQAIDNYTAEIRRDRCEERFILYGSTFFNGRWKDYIENEVTEDEDPYENIGLHV